MSSRPFMPLFVGDFLGDTMDLGRSEIGGYMLLIMNYWQRGGPLPDDDNALRQITRSTRYAWQKLRKNLQNFFTIRDGKWHHKRVDFELAKLKHKSDLDARNRPPSCAAHKDSRAAKPYPEESSPIAKTSTGVEDPRLGPARAAPLPGPEALTPDGAPPASVMGRGISLLGRAKAGLVGAMIKRFGHDRVRHALDTIEQRTPRDPPAFFRAICEGREARPRPPPEPPRRSRLVERLMHEQGRRKMRIAMGLPPTDEAA